MKLVSELHAGGGHAVSRLCAVLGVAPSGYYRRAQRTPQRQAEEATVVTRMQQEFVASHETYGSRRLTAALQAAGLAVNHKRIERLMRKHALVPHTVRRFRSLSRRAPQRRAAPNQLNQCFVADAPNRVWLADSTEFVTHEGKLYLAVLEDLCSRRVVGWATASRCTDELNRAALQHALDARGGARRSLCGLVHHSDQGAQYTSAAYLALLEQAGFVVSMSGSGNCYDNAPMESFIGTLKVEWTHPFTYATRSQLQTDLFDYIEGFYNSRRLHSALGYLSPAEFERRYHQQQLHPEEEGEPPQAP